MTSHVQRAAQLLELRRPAQAEEILRSHLALKPDDVTALLLLARAFIQQERFEEAHDAAADVVRLAPAEPAGHIRLAESLIGLDQSERAETVAREAIRLAPWTGGAHYTLARALQELRPAEALVAADKALELEPTNAQFHNVRAMCLGALGRRTEEEASYRTALGGDPDNDVALNNLAVTHLERGRLGASGRALLAALRANPQAALPRRNLVAMLVRITMRLAIGGVALGLLTLFLIFVKTPWFGRSGAHALLTGIAVVLGYRWIRPLSAGRFAILRSVLEEATTTQRVFVGLFLATFLYATVMGFTPDQLALAMISAPLLLAGRLYWPVLIIVGAVSVVRRFVKRR